MSQRPKFTVENSTTTVKMKDQSKGSRLIDLRKSTANTIQKAKDICNSKLVTITYIVQWIRITSYKVELIDSNLSLFLIWGQLHVHNK